jgi:hypothetical protein
MALNNPAFRAGGKIYPSRFVTIDATTSYGTDFVVTQAGASAAPIGVSQDGSRLTPGVQALTASDLYAADGGQPIQIYGLSDVCLLEVGTAANITAGQLLAPDANGAGILAATGKYAGAIALENAAKSTASQTNLVRVQVLPASKQA